MPELILLLELHYSVYTICYFACTVKCHSSSFSDASLSLQRTTINLKGLSRYSLWYQQFHLILKDYRNILGQEEWHHHVSVMPMNLILHKTFTTKSKYVHCLCSSFHLILYQHCYVFCIRLLHLTEARRWRPKLSSLTGKYPQFYEVPESVSPKQQSENCRYNLNFAYKLIYVCSSRAKSRLCFTILLKWNFLFQGKTSKEKSCRLYLPLRLFCQISGYQSLKAKLFKIQYHTVWPLAVKLPVNICSVQYFKLALMTEHSLEERKKMQSWVLDTVTCLWFIVPGQRLNT